MNPRHDGHLGPPRWVFIAGAARSGSTLLGVLLARATGGFDVGEMHLLWRNLSVGAPCHCGAAPADCEIWSAVADTVRRELGPSFTDAIESDRRYGRSPARRRVPRPSRADIQLREATEAAVERVTGAHVIIDTSKVAYVLASALRRGRPLLVIHLVRDPRAVAYSQLRPKTIRQLGGTSGAEPVWSSSIRWDLHNCLAECLTRVAHRRTTTVTTVRIRYEDLTADPVGVVDALCATLGVSVDSSDRPLHHALAGNTVLYEGTPVVAPDQRWVHDLPRPQQRLAATLTAPLLLRYGYSLRPSPLAAPMR